MLRPGGLAIMIEPETDPIIDNEFASEIARCHRSSGMAGWTNLWDNYRHCLRSKGIDISVPFRLRRLVQGTGVFGKVISQQADVPIGFWPKGA